MTVPKLETIDSAICGALETPITLALTFGNTEIRFSFSFKASSKAKPQLETVVDNTESDNEDSSKFTLPTSQTTMLPIILANAQDCIGAKHLSLAESSDNNLSSEIRDDNTNYKQSGTTSDTSDTSDELFGIVSCLFT